MKVLTIAVGSAALLAGAGALAQSTSKVPALVTNVTACKNQTDDQARLRCYDASAAALEAATAAGSLVFVNKEEVKQARRSLFGFDLPNLPFLSRDDRNEEKAVSELTAKLSSARGTGYGLWLLRLDTGGTWQTTEAQIDTPLPKAGENVVIKRGPLGNFMASVGGKRGLRVRRVS